MAPRIIKSVYKGKGLDSKGLPLRKIPVSTPGVEISSIFEVGLRIALNVLYGFLRRYFALFHTNPDIFETTYFVTPLRVQPRSQGAFPWLWRWGGKRPGKGVLS